MGILRETSTEGAEQVPLVTPDDDIECFVIPSTACNAPGFRDWERSEHFPRHVHAAYNNGFIVINPDLGEVRIPASALTLDGFCDWASSDDFPRRGSFSYIGNELLVDMSPEEVQKHSLVKGEVSWVLGAINRRSKSGMFCLDRVLVTNRGAGLSTEPDATFIKWTTFRSGRVQLVPRKGHPTESKELRGTPDWVLEVLSRGSITKDTQELRRAYHAAQVPEFWIVNALGDDEHVDLQILIHGPGDYQPAERVGDWQRSPTFNCLFRLTRALNSDGFWEYQLHTDPPLD